MRFIKILFSRSMIVVLSILLQLAIFVGVIIKVHELFEWVQFFSYALGLIVFLTIVNKDTKPENKLSWMVLVLLFPVFGVVIYLLFADVRISRRHVKRYLSDESQSKKIISNAKQDEQLIKESLGEYYGQARAIELQNGLCPFVNSGAQYFCSGEEFYDNLVKDLDGAKEFIFLEFFIINEGVMWNGILEILKKKVLAGVDVRVMYDDVGCMGLLPTRYHKRLNKLGIKCYKFNKFKPIVSSTHNYRDHRKIVVIDGKIAYTGGVNLADEYINVGSKFGHWKDSAVKITGKAVISLTLMFLQSYAVMSNVKEDYSIFIKDSVGQGENGVIQPFAVGPKKFYGYNLAENAILNIINSAKKYVYITTPYLICDYELMSSLKLAVHRGVEVNIIVPQIPDKRITWWVTRSNFEPLIREGVNIYQYSPGFIHQKTIIADDSVAILGTINLDYRSLVHHFEDGVFMYNTDCLKEIKKDVENILVVSQKQSLQSSRQRFISKLICAIIKIFTPLM